MSARARIAATGAAAFTPAGIGALPGEGAELLAAWLPRAGAGAAGAQVPDFDAAAWIRNPKLLRSMHRGFQLGTAAAVLAMRAAGLPLAENLPAAGIAPERAGVAAALADVSPLTSDLLEVLAACGEGSGDGGAIAWGRFAELGLHQLHPFRRLTLLANMAAAHTSLLFGLQGPSFTFTSGAAAGAQTIEQALWTIAEGRAELMVCQSADSPAQSFARRPGPEMAGALVLERWETAAARHAPVLAELVPGPARLEAAGGSAPTLSLLQALGRLTPAAIPPRLELGELLAPRAAAPAARIPAAKEKLA